MPFQESPQFTKIGLPIVATGNEMCIRDRLSSIRPSALMQGKIIGHFILGLIQLGFWLVLGLPLAIYFLDFSLLEALRGVNLAAILFFGLGGYLLYSALFVGLGATMEDVRSAGNAQGLVVMLPILAFLLSLIHI